MPQPTDDDWRAIYAAAFLAYVRDQADWSPPPFDDAPREPRPAQMHRGSDAWFADMRRRHRQIQRGRR
ncbi:hypothetical protein KXD97_28215 [Mycobacterium sp. SMC-8]|uniref:hypothetical protein n=1 Tax=Mycobacterium sp. SMC-8 TaxID=2857060 RepID=UPI0021B452D1|nr:hypothetical protein [Mycobacterium sp. SMC-8]UXA11802.1 hypothetical protein KXD97_28215 [Mycobacterium sp. SMC-8]